MRAVGHELKTQRRRCRPLWNVQGGSGINGPDGGCVGLEEMGRRVATFKRRKGWLCRMQYGFKIKGKHQDG